jgi:ABC-type branched-subunit amino acid transport system ATPase component
VRYGFKKLPRKHYKHFTVIGKKLNLFRDLKQSGINDHVADLGDGKAQCPESFGPSPLGRALVHDPRILFLDEPTTGLDPQAKRLIWDYFLSLKGKRTLFTTHSMQEADFLGAFDDGSWGMWFHRVVQKTMEEYRVNPGKPPGVGSDQLFPGRALF